MRTQWLVIILVGLALIVGGCDEEKLPSRDQIPILKQKLYALEQAVDTRNRAAIDSLLSVEILDEKRSRYAVELNSITGLVSYTLGGKQYEPLRTESDFR